MSDSNIRDISFAQFIAFAATKGIDTSVGVMHLTHPPKFARFANAQAQEAWEFWEASREAIVIRIPDEHGPVGSFFSDGVDACRVIIEKHGLKVTS